MATRKTVDKIQIKRGSGDTLSDNQNNTKLEAGEPFYHVKTGRVYIGNGENKISDLPYLQANESDGVALGINGTIASNHGVAIGNNSYAGGGISIGTNVASVSKDVSIGENIRANPSDRGIYIGFDSGPCSAFTSSLSSIVIGVNSKAVAIDMRGGANRVISIGTNTIAYANDSVSIGHGANASGVNAVSIGTNTVSAEGGVAIGTNSFQEYKSICIGEDSNSVRTNSIAIGNGSKITNIGSDATENAISIGTGAEAMSGSSVAIGRTCRAGGNETAQTGNSCIAIGEDANARGETSIAIGAPSKSFGTRAIALGSNSFAEKDDDVAIGTNSYSTGSNCIAIGLKAKSDAQRAIAFGTCAIATHAGAISIGSYSNAGRLAVDIGGSAKSGGGGNFVTRDVTGISSVSILGFAGGGGGVSIGEASSAGKSSVSVGYNAISVASNEDSLSRVAIGENAVASETNGARIQFFDHRKDGFENHAFIGSSTILLSGSSDRRLKQNIESANTEICLSDVCSIPLYRYEYKPFVKETEDKHLVGWMADDVEKVFKHAVFEGDRTFTECDEDGNDIIDSETGEPKQFTIEKVKSINMQRVGLPTLWGAVQELSRLMTATQERVTELETAVKTLKKENTLLKKQLKELETATKEEPSVEE